MSSPENHKGRIARWRAEGRAAFPYEIVRVRGADALREWEHLGTPGRGVPVVIGGDEELERLMESFRPDHVKTLDEPDVAAILRKADQLNHPDGLLAFRVAERERVEAQFASDPGLLETLGNSAPPVGEWPSDPGEPAGLTVATDWATGRPYDNVHVVFIPTEDPTAIPAWLRWGGWNENPLPEYHVAALRSWRDRYGAELIGLGSDVMNIRVARRPGSRDEALALAHEQYDYCNDIVGQGALTLSALAASLMAQDWWFFWWD